MATSKPIHYFYILCDPDEVRTRDPNIKSVVLYQLSYEIKNRFSPDRFHLIYHVPTYI